MIPVGEYTVTYNRQFTLTGFPCEYKEGETMKYEAEGWKETKIEVGKIIDTEVTSIDEGKISSFVKDWGTFDKTGSADPNQEAIQVKTDIGASVLIALPKTKEFHPKSKLGKWIKTYGKAPFVGQKVRAMTDTSGFFNVVLAQ